MTLSFRRVLSGRAALLIAASSGASASFGSNFALDTCFDRSYQGVCSEIIYTRVGDTISENFELSDVSPVGSSVDGHLAVDSFGFTPPPAGLLGADPNDGVNWYATTTPLHDRGVPTTTFTYESRGNGAVNAVRPAGASLETQGVIWAGAVDDGVEFFPGTSGATEVEVRLTYTLDATLGAPTSASSTTNSGSVSISGGLTINDPSGAQAVSYFGDVIFEPSATAPVFPTGEWDPGDPSDTGGADVINETVPFEEVHVAIDDELSFMAQTGMTYDIDAFFSGGGFVQLYLDGGAINDPTGLDWFSSSQNTFVVSLEVLTPGATLVVGEVIPEPATAVLIGLAGAAAAARRVAPTNRRRGTRSAAARSALPPRAPSMTRRRKDPLGRVGRKRRR